MTLVIAHRGASFEAPENTLSSIKRAIALGVDCIEIDIHLTSDGIPVVIHDPTLQRTTNAQSSIRVEEITLEELKKLDAGSWFSSEFTGETIPTLAEVLSLNRQGIKLMIEIKKGIVQGSKLVNAILPHLPKNDPTIHLGSFELDIVEALQSTDYSLIGIVEEPENIQKFLDQGLSHLAIWSQILEPRLIETLHEKGVDVWVFTVDDIDKASFLRSIGVDGIITNHPRKISEGY